MTDPRLTLAATLEREADQDWKAANWLSDLVTERCRSKRELARSLREQVASEREAAALAAEADRALDRGMRKKARAA